MHAGAASSRRRRSPPTTRCRASTTSRARPASTSTGSRAAPSSTTSTATAGSTSCVSAIGFADQMRFFWNRGDGTFEDRTDAAGLTGEVGGLNLIQADYDNDGLLDVLVLRGGWMWLGGPLPAVAPAQQRRRHVRGRHARPPGSSASHPTQTAAWFDYDGDGWLDLFVGNESMPKDTDPTIHPAELFHNNRDGTFTERRARRRASTSSAFVKGVDQRRLRQRRPPRPLRLRCRTADNLLFHNDGPPATPGGAWRFTDVAAAGGRAAAEHAASARSSSTTTTTAGRTCSSSATAGRTLRRTWPPTTSACPTKADRGRSSTATAATAPSRT